MSKFKEETYGQPEEKLVTLTRKQIEQMSEMISHFKDINVFTLRISHASGIGPTVRLTFDIDLTDVSKW